MFKKNPQIIVSIVFIILIIIAFVVEKNNNLQKKKAMEKEIHSYLHHKYKGLKYKLSYRDSGKCYTDDCAAYGSDPISHSRFCKKYNYTSNCKRYKYAVDNGKNVFYVFIEKYDYDDSYNITDDSAYEKIEN